MKFELRFNIHAKRTGVRKSNEGWYQCGEIVAECLPVSRIVSIARNTSVSGLSVVGTYQTKGWSLRNLALTYFLETLQNTPRMHWSMSSVPQIDFLTSVRSLALTHFLETLLNTPTVPQIDFLTCVLTFFSVCFLFAPFLLSFLFSVLRLLSQLSSVSLCTKNGC